MIFIGVAGYTQEIKYPYSGNKMDSLSNKSKHQSNTLEKIKHPLTINAPAKNSTINVTIPLTVKGSGIPGVKVWIKAYWIVRHRKVDDRTMEIDALTLNQDGRRKIINTDGTWSFTSSISLETYGNAKMDDRLWIQITEIDNSGNIISRIKIPHQVSNTQRY